MNLSDVNWPSFEGGICFLFDSFKGIALHGFSNSVQTYPLGVLSVKARCESIWGGQHQIVSEAIRPIEYFYQQKVYRCLEYQLTHGVFLHFIMEELGEEVLLMDVPLSGKLIAADDVLAAQQKIVKPILWP